MERINQGKSNYMKVVFKQDTDVVAHDTERDVHNPSPSIKEMIEHFLTSLSRLKVALHHQLEHRTLGLFGRIGGITLVKVCIITIIMLFILKQDIALDFKMTNFAAENTIGESTHTSTSKRKAVENKAAATTTTSLGNAVQDLSPAAPEDLREAQVRDYIARYSQTAVGEMDKFGIPASISMAQAIVESRSGTSILAVKNNNHFGVKCFSKSCPKGHCANFTDDHHKDFFRKYAGSWDSWREHSHFLMKNSYRKLLKHGKDYRSWAKGLRECGYATDQSYDKKLIAIIERYDLQKLDDL